MKPPVGSVVKFNRGDGPEWGLVVDHGDGEEDYVVPLGKGADPSKFSASGDGGGGTYWVPK